MLRRGGGTLGRAIGYKKVWHLTDIVDCFVLFGCHKGKVSQVNHESHGVPPEYELDLGCRETPRMEDHTRSDPYRVGRPELKLLLASLGAEAIYVGCCGTHHKFDDVGSNGLDNTRSRIVDGEGGGRVPTHEPDETSEDLHSQADVA